VRPLDQPAAVRPTVLIAAGAAVAFIALTLAVLAHLRPLLSLDAAISRAALTPRWQIRFGARRWRP
jgi:Flp pilus assembly protein TadB